jgi:hypothetical protein
MSRTAIIGFVICASLALVGCRDRQRTIDPSSTANTTPRTTAENTSAQRTSAGSVDFAEKPLVDTAETPTHVVRRYYDAIRRHDYSAAYALWADGGKASNQTEATFAAGFAQTTDVKVNPIDSVTVEGAAGSQYATVPVTVDAILRGGRRQHFEGTYTLRRSMVDGATPEQRRWRIYSSDLKG